MALIGQRKKGAEFPAVSSFSLGVSACQWICSSSEHVRCWDNIDTAIISIAERTGQPMRMGSDQYSENGMAINGARVRHCITTYHSVV